MKLLYFIGLNIALTLNVQAQDDQFSGRKDSLLSRIPRKYMSSVQSKADRLPHFMDIRTGRDLKRMVNLENKLQKQLEKADPAQVDELFRSASNKVSNLKEKVMAKTGFASAGSGLVDNYTDTLETTLKFLQGTKLRGIIDDKNLESVKKSFSAMKEKLTATEDLQAQLRDRRKQLMERLSSVAGCKKTLNKLGRKVDYYNQQVNEYKAILQEPSKAEKKAMELLRKSDLYKNFFQKNSMLAGLFNINMSEDPTLAIQGLQTRDLVDQRILTSLGSDPAARDAFSQQMEQARNIIDQAKDKLPGGSGSVGDLPDQQLNPMKTKRFLERLEYGADIQSQRSNNLLPTMTDIALQAGYKFNPKAVAGIGMVYKLGWGNTLSHFKLTNEGIGIRSFASYKVKCRIHAMAGLEYNYFMRINTVDQLKDWNGWTKSSLAGVKIMLRENSKPKASLILLYDFKAARTIPASSPLKMRYQYTF